MSLTVGESQAVFDLLRWLAQHENYRGELLTDAEAIEAMELLATAAGRRLQLSPDAKLPSLIVERLQAADSDGAAQAVCRALEAKRPGLGTATVQYALDEWRGLQYTELGERLRDQTTDPAEWGTVDV